MNELEPIRVLIVDDHPSVREGLAELVSAQVDMSVVGEASDGLEAVAMFESLQPDVTVMDLNLPRLSGLEAMSEIRLASPHSRFIVVTGFQGKVSPQEAALAGASAYLLKEMFGEELLAAIRAVHAGEEFFPALSPAPNQS